MSKNDQSQFEKEINRVEETFLELGADRMSKFFGVKNFKNHISSEHVLWVQGNNGYYHIKAKREHKKKQIVVQYSASMDKGFKDYSQFEYTEDSRLTEIVNGIIHGVLPQEEEILNMYIDISDEPFEPDPSVITKELPLDNNINITLTVYLDPKKQAEVLADYAWISYEGKKDTIQENNTDPVQDLLDAFFGYWEAGNYKKTLSVALEIKKIIKEKFPQNDYLCTLADLYKFLGLYLSEDYVSARNLGENMIADTVFNEDSLFIKVVILDFLSTTYYFLGQTDKAIMTSEENFKIRMDHYGLQNSETIRAKLKYDLYKGIDSSPQKAIEDADVIYKFFLKTEGKHGDNTAAALSNLSYLLASFGAYNQALMADSLLYKIYEQKYGRDDQLTLFSLQDMAIDISHIEENIKDAETLAKYAYDRAALKYGNTSLEASIALSTQAMIDTRIGAFGRALLAQEKSYEIIESLFGLEHSRTMKKKEVLAEAYRTASRVERGTRSLEKALELDKAVYEWKKSIFGENDLLTVETEEKVIFDKYLIGETQEALDQQYKLIARCEKAFGPDDLSAVERYLKYSYMLSGMKKYEEALATDKYMLQKLKNIFAEEHPYILQTVENIAHDLMDLRRWEEASDFAYDEAVKRVELLGEYHEHTRKMIDIYADIKQQMQMVVHYFNYHVPYFMGFELQKEEGDYILYYSEGDGVHEENKKTVNVSELDVEELINILKPSLAWDKHYEGDPSINGEGFELEVQYNDVHVESSGKFAFPDGYEEVHRRVLDWKQKCDMETYSHTPTVNRDSDEKEREIVMSFDEIMKEITNGLTGDSQTDIEYLQKTMEQYKEHDLSKEIIRACGRLIYSILPDDKKEEINSLISKDFIADDQILEEVRFNAYKKNYKHALELIEPLVKKIEEMFDSGMYQNDTVSEYYSFKELFEEVLYATKYEPKREIRKVDYQVDEIYLVYGSVLVDNGRIDDAQKALEKAIRWNPMNAKIAFEHAETYKMQGNLEEFFRLSKEIFKIAFTKEDLARCYRNMAYYFVEKQLWQEAVACNRISLCYDEQSKSAQSELYYIQQVVGDVYKEPSVEEFKNIAETYGFPTGADQDILGIAFAYGKHFLEDGKSDAASYFLNIVYDLTEDEKIKEILDDIKAI